MKQIRGGSARERRARANEGKGVAKRRQSAPDVSPAFMTPR